jgi:regulator of replication initiation timing
MLIKIILLIVVITCIIIAIWYHFREINRFKKIAENTFNKSIMDELVTKNITLEICNSALRRYLKENVVEFDEEKFKKILDEEKRSFGKN